MSRAGILLTNQRFLINVYMMLSRFLALLFGQHFQFSAELQDLRIMVSPGLKEGEDWGQHAVTSGDRDKVAVKYSVRQQKTELSPTRHGWSAPT